MAESSREPDAAPRNPWKRLSRRLAYENPWIALYDDRVIRPDGAVGIYGVVHFKARAVGVVALDSRDQVLLVGQYRYTLDAYSWEIPEGGAPFDEELLAAAQRELREETGFEARAWRLLARVHLSNSVSDEEGFVYLASDLQPGPASPEPTEVLQVRWLPFDEALEMTRSGAITDSLSIIALQRVALDRSSPHSPASGETGGG